MFYHSRINCIRSKYQEHSRVIIYVGFLLRTRQVKSQAPLRHLLEKTFLLVFLIASQMKAACHKIFPSYIFSFLTNVHATDEQIVFGVAFLLVLLVTSQIILIFGQNIYPIHLNNYTQFLFKKKKCSRHFCSQPIFEIFFFEQVNGISLTRNALIIIHCCRLQTVDNRHLS